MVGPPWESFLNSLHNQEQGANLDSSVDVAEVELPASDMFNIDLKQNSAPVKVKEDGVVVDIGGHILCLWPWWRLLKENFDYQFF